MIDVAVFQNVVYSHYAAHKRVLPWRSTTDPYAIMVSEIMLQQTQVERVIEKFNAWMTRFPTVFDLAKASLGDVLVLWSGLGYNRRAKFLWQAAQKIVTDFNGEVPSDISNLTSLPGVGGYTAAAITAFAFNQPAVVVETNIRAVYIHFFFSHQEKVADNLLMPLIEATMDKQNPRDWFNALMDYGAKLKSELDNPTRKSTHYTKQSSFSGSNRQIRGAILKLLAQGKTLSALPFEHERVMLVLNDLVAEALIEKDGDEYRLP